MKSRETLFLIVGAALLAAMALLALGAFSGAPLDHPSDEVMGLPEGLPERTPPPEADPLVGEAPPVVAEARDERGSPAIDTSSWTSGVILGDIQISVSVLDRIQSINVTVEENRELSREDGQIVRPYTRTQSVEMRIGTPTFEFRDVPFSSYGYTVRAFSPGLNGSSQTIALNESQPFQEVLLGIQPGVPFSVLLRDQHQNPVPGVEITLAPVGDPPGRPLRRETADNNGSRVFEDTLAGDYRVFVGHVEQPMADPVDVTVQPPGQSFGPGQPVKGQFCKIEVPRGEDLLVSVVGAQSYGLEGVKLKLLATDQVMLRVLEGETDYNGRFVFRHLPPGKYQLDAHMKDHERRTVTVAFKEGEIPGEQVIRLPRIR